MDWKGSMKNVPGINVGTYVWQKCIALSSITYTNQFVFQAKLGCYSCHSYRKAVPPESVGIVAQLSGEPVETIVKLF